MLPENMKVAIVYDWIDKWGGVERLLTVLHEMFPRAPLYTSYADTQQASWAKGMTIKTSFIQSLPAFVRKSRILSFFLYPYAFESFDFSRYDLVISITSSFAKAVVTKPGTFHLCILLTPTRYLWLYPSHYLSRPVSWLLKPFISHMKNWDKAASARPDRYVSISREVASRCKAVYGRPSEVVYPPFDEAHWGEVKKHLSAPSRLPFGRKDFFLVVSRLEPYKKVDIVIEAFNREKSRNLIVVGKGSLLSRLKKKASSGNIQFMQDLTDRELGYLYAAATALIMPQIEDFGYTALEAQYLGCPVISCGQGGVRETVEEGKTGLFFPKQTEESLRLVLARYDKISYNLKHQTQASAGNTAQRFSRELFEKTLSSIIINSVAKQNNQQV